jgi:hypothetical protein
MLIGMGQASAGTLENCPSLQQAQGIVDCTDVCQIGGPACPVSTATPATPTACPSGSTCTIVPGIPNSNIYLAVGAVASLFLASTIFGGGRR